MPQALRHLASAALAGFSALLVACASPDVLRVKEAEIDIAFEAFFPDLVRAAAAMRD